MRALVALAARRVRLVREAARTEADGFAAAGKAVLFEYRARRGAHGAAAEGVRAEVAVRARPRGRRAEDGLEAALGASEGRRPLLQRRRPRCCRLPQPGERGGRREQIAGDDGCYYFEQVGRHGVRRGYSRAGIIVKVSCLCSIYPAGVRRSALSETATWQTRAPDLVPRRRRLIEPSTDPSHAAGLLSTRGALFSGFTVGFGCKTAKRGS